MRDMWNPWHGCRKISEGCKNCYMYYLDSQRGLRGNRIFRVAQNFDYPLHKDRRGMYKIKSGEFLMTCMTSDFFLEEADQWREEVWDIIRQRPDIVFILVTKRPERVANHLPEDWGSEGWENVWFHITVENQLRADQRIPILLNLPFKHKGIMTAPLIGPVSIERYLEDTERAKPGKKIENVWCGGENYEGSRPLRYEWVKALSDECKRGDVTFSFFETGNVFVDKNGIKRIIKKADQRKEAYLCGLNYESYRKQRFEIKQGYAEKQLNIFELPKNFKEGCKYCIKRNICHGCSECGKCR